MISLAALWYATLYAFHPYIEMEGAAHEKNLTRRGFVKVSSVVGAVLAGAATGKLGAQATGFQAASNAGGPRNRPKKGPGLQGLYALSEITGGGVKVYGIAIEYDVEINPASVALDTYTTSVFPSARGGGEGMGLGPGTNWGQACHKIRRSQFLKHGPLWPSTPTLRPLC